LTEKGHSTIMRLYPRDDRQGEFIAPWIADKYKGKKIAILHDKSAYEKGLAQVVKDKLNVAGVTEILFEGSIRAKRTIARSSPSLRTPAPSSSISAATTLRPDSCCGRRRTKATN
jgi:hypothetical protein